LRSHLIVGQWVMLTSESTFMGHVIAWSRPGREARTKWSVSSNNDDWWRWPLQTSTSFLFCFIFCNFLRARLLINLNTSDHKKRKKLSLKLWALSIQWKIPVFFGWVEIAPWQLIERSTSANQNGFFAIGLLYNLCCFRWGLLTDH